jgi:hypothetical protein
MTEHQLIGIRPRPEIGPKSSAWHEAGCSCGWSGKYPSAYTGPRFMHERNVEREMDRNPA